MQPSCWFPNVWDEPALCRMTAASLMRRGSLSFSVGVDTPRLIGRGSSGGNAPISAGLLARSRTSRLALCC